MASSGNFSTLNPLSAGTDINDGTMSNGNLKYAFSGADAFRNTMAMTHKTYCEVYINSIGGYGGTIGLCSQQNKRSYEDTICFQINYQSGRIYHYKGSSEQNAGSNNAGSTVSAGQVVMMAYDPATYKWWVGINGTWNGSQDPANGNNPCFTGSATMFEDMSGVFWGGWKGDSNGLTCHWNFGADSSFSGTISAGSGVDDNGFGNFKYSPPSGFLALCSGNQVISDDIDPAQTDSDYPAKQFNIVTLAGNSGSQAISGLGFQPDLVWFKNRTSTDDYSNALIDSSRGRAKVLYSHSTRAELSSASDKDLVSFDSDGFTLGANEQTGANYSGKNYVAWAWRANGGTTSTNNEGNHTCTLQANANAGFSIMTLGNYTSASGVTIGHGLNKAPSFYIHKPLSGSKNWHVYHSSLGATKALLMNSYSASATAIGYWANTEPTADVLSLGNTHAGTGDGIVYAWAEVDGYSKFSFFEGNSNANGTFVYTGFRPRMLFVKDIDRGENWQTFDSARNTFNSVDKGLMWNDNSAESTGSGSGFDVDFLSNGFKMRCTHDNLNGSSTYIYGAWGDVSFKYNNTF